MTAISYLNGHIETDNDLWHASKAVEMARKEEREKAVKLHMKYCGNYRCRSNKKSFGNNECGGNCLIMKEFKKDLNK